MSSEERFSGDDDFRCVGRARSEHNKLWTRIVYQINAPPPHSQHKKKTLLSILHTLVNTSVTILLCILQSTHCVSRDARYINWLKTQRDAVVYLFYAGL